MRFPWMDARDIQASAECLLDKAFGRGRVGAASVDLDSLVYDYLCQNESLSFDDEHDLGIVGREAILGRTTPLAGKIEITVGLKAAGEQGRYRFTLAHEIGHWVLHRPLYVAEAASLDLFRAAESDRVLASVNRTVFPRNGQALPPEEWQANYFATALLIDSEALRREFVERFDSPVIARLAGNWRRRSRTLREHSRMLAAQEAVGRKPSLASVFGLSVEAMAIALEARGYSVEDVALL